jgi:hypothetical protein
VIQIWNATPTEPNVGAVSTWGVDMSTGLAKEVILHLDQDHCLCAYGATVLSFSLQPPNPRYLAAWTKAVDDLVKQTSGPIAVLIVIDSAARPPDETSKKEIRKTTTRHGQSIGAFAYVIEGEGFGAAAVRSAVSLISLAARYPFPQKVFRNAGEAAAWMLPRLPADAEKGVTAGGVLTAVEGMRHSVKKLAVAI